MMWHQWFALLSAGICLSALVLHFIRLLKSGKPHDHASFAGDYRKGIRYSFTGAMNPAKKESAYLHLPTYLAGLLYHTGTFMSLVIFILTLSGIVLPGIIALIVAIYCGASVVAGMGILLKRAFHKNLRSLSSPDDYISNILVTVFQAFTAMVLLQPLFKPFFFISAGILFLYIPVGKLRHVLYFFFARYHLGYFFGWRGVWPPAKK